MVPPVCAVAAVPPPFALAYNAIKWAFRADLSQLAGALQMSLKRLGELSSNPTCAKRAGRFCCGRTHGFVFRHHRRKFAPISRLLGRRRRAAICNIRSAACVVEWALTPV